MQHELKRDGQKETVTMQREGERRRDWHAKMCQEEGERKERGDRKGKLVYKNVLLEREREREREA